MKKINTLKMKTERSVTKKRDRERNETNGEGMGRANEGVEREKK